MCKFLELQGVSVNSICRCSRIASVCVRRQVTVQTKPRVLPNPRVENKTRVALSLSEGQSDHYSELVVLEVVLPYLQLASDLYGSRPRYAVSDGGVSGPYPTSLTRRPDNRAGAIQTGGFVCRALPAGPTAKINKPGFTGYQPY